jgi:hypothetical protein
MVGFRLREAADDNATESDDGEFLAAFVGTAGQRLC